ncbi:MAG: hypothetical protein FWG44_01315 [Oscillospiraceae bacterium]|nr:hypothetical protein [Oscillospiraceae bacterium]
MNCCLWLNGVKIWHAEDIKSNFDITSLRGYLSGGSLMPWLIANGGELYVRKLTQTAYSNDLNARLAYAFGLSEKPPEDYKIVIFNPPSIHQNTPLIHLTTPLKSSFGLWLTGSFQSYSSGSFYTSDSYRFGSGSFGSYGSFGHYGSFGSYAFGSCALNHFGGYGVHII